MRTTTMLAEIFLLRIEQILRVNGPAISSDTRFVPIAVPAKPIPTVKPAERRN